jgi:hypothetical protein
LRSTDFKLLRIINENLLNECDFFNFIASVKGGHCYCSPRRLINLTTPLNIPHNSVNNKTDKPLPMQQWLHSTPNQTVATVQSQVVTICIVCCNINAVCTVCTHCSLSDTSNTMQQHTVQTTCVLSGGWFEGPNYTKRTVA